MKTKSTVYVLIACVAAVWGIIFFKVFTGISGEEEGQVTQERAKKIEYFNLVDHREEISELESASRDPFKGLEYKQQENDLTVEKPGLVPAPVMPLAAKPQVNWSGIYYRGYISNPGSKQKIAMLSVNGKEAMLSVGESFGGVKLLAYATDSVKVSYQQAVKYIIIK
ncbi:hypothetical protein QWY86_15455 [Pedobacter aquatilis]|uniref:hypothetical protein n=1 Tax=Pedobacter aquatilis TaxID=351343 RepID=UPI0025B2EE60|nr:hypothetical protein [Pedobacter aquatilis]MDN3588079.1 hypothetical protein [Pedobacter aquatilis]